MDVYLLGLTYLHWKHGFPEERVATVFALRKKPMFWL